MTSMTSLGVKKAILQRRAQKKAKSFIFSDTIGRSPFYSVERRASCSPNCLGSIPSFLWLLTMATLIPFVSQPVVI